MKKFCTKSLGLDVIKLLRRRKHSFYVLLAIKTDLKTSAWFKRVACVAFGYKWFAQKCPTSRLPTIRSNCDVKPKQFSKLFTQENLVLASHAMPTIRKK